MNKRDFLKIILNASSLIFLSAFPNVISAVKKIKVKKPEQKAQKKGNIL